MDQIRKRHTELLARAIKRKCAHKYVAVDTVFRPRLPKTRPVFPEMNKRLTMLATSVGFKTTRKFEPEPEPSTCVSRAVLEAICSARLDHLSKPTVRVLEAMRKEKKNLGKAFIDVMTDKIGISLDTIYYHNRKSLMNIEAHKMKIRLMKKPKTWDEIGDKERLLNLSKPKRIWNPMPARHRQWKKLKELKETINKLSVPVKFYKRPSQESVLVRLRVSPAAMKYIVSERIRQLTELPPWRLVKPYEPVAVKRSALFYELTERTKQLAVPNVRAHAIESDLKENPYDINPSALTYKATPRITELAKPIER